MSDVRPAVPRPSAAVVLARDGADGGISVFMVRRHARSDFAPDVYVFPGGSVQEQDRLIEREPGRCTPAPDGPTAPGSGVRVAALRECFEEAGVLLARRGAATLAVTAADVERYAAYRDALNSDRMGLGEVAEREGLTLATDVLVHWAHWITPEAWPRRFDTHFFLAAMPEGQQAAHDRLETTGGVWMRPEDALVDYQQGAFPLVFATVRQLEALCGLPSVAAARERFAGQAVRTIVPRAVQRDGAEVILMPDEDEEDA